MKTAAIWGGALTARHACVVGCKLERYHNVNVFRGGSSTFLSCLSARSLSLRRRIILCLSVFSWGGCLLLSFRFYVLPRPSCRRSHDGAGGCPLELTNSQTIYLYVRCFCGKSQLIIIIWYNDYAFYRFTFFFRPVFLYVSHISQDLTYNSV
jgi:hypothetical protein